MRLLPVIVCALSGVSLTLSATFEQLFHLKQGSANEVCKENQKSLIRSWLADALELTSTVNKGLESPQDDPVMIKNLHSFLGISYTIQQGSSPTIDEEEEEKLDEVKCIPHQPIYPFLRLLLLEMVDG